MPTAKKRGNKWRCQVYAYTDANGTAHTKSFTASTKKEAERLASQYVYKPDTAPSMTLSEAIDKYTTDRSSVLSPSTVRSYKAYQRTRAQELMNIKISSLTNQRIQRAVNADAAEVSPKTIRNVYGMIGAVLHAYRPDFHMEIKLPPKVRPDLTIPTDQDIKNLLDVIRGSKLELPVLLAAFGPMRRGEICALEHSDISGNIVHVHRNMVLSNDNEWVVKYTKSYAGDRYIVFPDFVAAHFTDGEGRVFDFSPTYITNTFEDARKKIGINCRFHDLRHYCASFLHTIMPDQYIMQRGGWSTDGTLKAVYRHALDDQAARFNELANQNFTKNFTI